jgi:hypothetical protein
MQPYLKKAIVILSLSVCFIWPVSRGIAYVLPGLHILELVSQNFRNSKRLLVSQKLNLYNDIQENKVELLETLRYVFPETFRSDILTENVQRIHVLFGGTALTIIDGRVAAAAETRYDDYKDIILFNSRPLLEKRLALHGVDATISSLGRLEGRPVLVLGAQYPDETIPQVWIDKDTFLPLRWIVTPKTDDIHDDSLEIFYLDWRKVQQIWYPFHIKFIKSETLVREIKVLNVEVNPSFSKDLFDISLLKSTYLPATTEKPDSSDTEELNEVQKTIDQFKRIYE